MGARYKTSTKYGTMHQEKLKQKTQARPKILRIPNSIRHKQGAEAEATARQSTDTTSCGYRARYTDYTEYRHNASREAQHTNIN